MKNRPGQITKIESVSLSFLPVILLVFFAFTAPTLWAQVISADQARLVAEQFMKTQTVNKSGFVQRGANSRSPALQKIYQSPDSIRNPLYCFQSSNAGFVLVSANGGDFLIVGYSPTGSFDPGNIPDALKSLMNRYEYTERFDPGTTAESKSTTVIVEPLLDKKGIKLNQFAHENVGGCPSGCVATSMAQILSYYKYPSTGTGSNCYTHPVYGQLCADFGKTTYNWTNMTDADYKLLSYHLGVAMNMNYCAGWYGSSPSASNYYDVLQKNFRYNIHFATSESFYIKNELDNNRPVYSELLGNVGHSVVIDGYDADGYFHLNFGWGGSSNGYYLMNNNSTFYAGYTFGTNISTSLFISPTPFKINQKDSLALVRFYNSMNGNTGWDLTKPVSSWPGVIVMNERVISLKLNNLLEGTIPDEIGNLTSLQNLNIKVQTTGTFPIALTKLTDLKELSINFYSYDANPPKVTLPPEIGNLVNLEILSISAEGSIPKTIGNLKKLKSLDLSRGRLTGGIPDEFYSLTNLEVLKLGKNQLSGVLSARIGQLSKLKAIELEENQFSGPLPVEIGKLTDLTDVWISDNQFSGPIPESIGNWTKLQNLYINNNAFEGMVPHAICKFAQFTTLKINNNKFAALPDSIGNLLNLKQLIGSNNLIKSIPVSLGKLSKLNNLDLMNNQLTTFPDLGSMPALVYLNLSNNRIGVLPESFGQMVKITELYLDNNQLTGLPASIQNLTSLRTIYLKGNKLSYLPLCFALFSNLKELYLANNQISGALPPLSHLGLLDFWIQGNRLVFSDIAASRMPDDLIYSDDYTFLYNEQAKVAVTDSVFSFAAGDPVAIDIRSISRLLHPGNVYHWYKDGQAFQSGAVLKIASFDNSQKGSYFCRISNPNYKRNLCELETHPIILLSAEDLLGRNGFQTNSRSNSKHVFTDHQVMLVTPPEVRGDHVWQASVDSVNWFSVSENPNLPAVKQNVVAASQGNVLVEPKTPVLFRYVVKDGTCDPVISDAIRIKPYGLLLLDTLINVQNKVLTVKKDSIEIQFPANFTKNQFRLTIEKLSSPPAAPESIKLSSVYDVNVSCGSIFEVPLIIKFKNINKKTFNKKNIDKYQAMYFDDRNQKWEKYINSRLSLKDSTLVFETSHLTKLAWGYDRTVSGYTDVFTRHNISVYYKTGTNGEGDLGFIELYDKSQTRQEWHASPGAAGFGTPMMIQDITEYLHEVIVKLKSLNLNVTDEPFTVYVHEMTDDGEVGIMGMMNSYLNINRDTKSPERLRSVLAHEYMHYTQGKYFPPHEGNKFWIESTAHLTDRMVWNETILPVSESDHYLLDGRTSKNSIFDFLSTSWDYYDHNMFTGKWYGSSHEGFYYLAGTFMHYMRSYKEGTRLKPEALLYQETSVGDWINYLDSYIQKDMKSTIGDEYEGFIKYIVEGSNENFTLLNKKKGEDPIKYLSSAPNSFVQNKLFKFKNEKVLKDSVQFEVPYLAAKMVQLYNLNANQKIVVRYKRKSVKNDNLKVYLWNYNTPNAIMTYEDISDKDSSTFIIRKPSGDSMDKMAFLTFINTGKSEHIKVDYQLKIYNIPDFKMFDDFGFTLGYGTANEKIHSITDGTSEKLDEIPITPQIFRKFHGPLTYDSTTNDSTVVMRASSGLFEQTTTYNYLTGKMIIHDKENWGGAGATAPVDVREMTMVLNDVWLTPYPTNSLGITYTFKTNTTAETQKVVKSISYTRKYAAWNDKLIPPAHDPAVNYKYTRTNYSGATQFNDIKFHMQFY